MMPLLLISLLFLSLIFFLLKTNARKSGQPPSPPRLPIIGNLHQLGSLPHRSLHALSQNHGPLMLVHLGATPNYVVSSADMAREVMKTHDAIFSDRPSSIVSDELMYAGKDVAFSQYGEYWRQVRKISVLQLLTPRRVEFFRSVREDEVELMIKAISESSTPINLGEILTSFTSNVVSIVAFGKKYSFDERNGINFHQLLKEFLALLGAFHIGDLFPSPAWIASFTSLNAKLKKNSKEWDTFLDQVIEDHLVIRREKDNKGGEDFVHVLLEIQENGEMGASFGKDNIKAILLDNFAAGTDTTYTLMEWTMTELIRHPSAMKKVQEEVRKLVQGGSKLVTEDDLQQMQYLKSAIKEAMRLHPPLPLLVPRQTTQDVKLQGYQIPTKSKIIVSAWAIGRDPKYWEDPEEFRPERFMDTNIDFKGRDYQLIPFGAGRRGCPGIPFAIPVIEIALANLLYRFDWQLPGGRKGEEIDMAETFGITVHKKAPLIVVARPHFT